MATTKAVTVADGRYQIEARLGFGGQAVVFKVYDNRLRVHRAMKVLLPRFARRSHQRSRFESEAQSMANLDHPHIVRVLDVVPDSPLPFIVMELFPGGSLARWIDENGPVPPRLSVQVALQVASGLDAAHRHGIIHRDVKPHNVLIDNQGICKLGDFGIARMEREFRTRGGSSMGTEGYMAPEQEKDASRADARADIYGLGMTLWVAVSGRDPMRLQRADGMAFVPEPLKRVIERATSEDPRNRQPNVGVFAQQLEQSLRALPADPPVVSLAQSAVPGEVDGFAEIAQILDGNPALQQHGEEGPRPTPYIMPTMEERVIEGTPEWVEKDLGPNPRPFTVGVTREDLMTPPGERPHRSTNAAPTPPPPVLDPTPKPRVAEQVAAPPPQHLSRLEAPEPSLIDEIMDLLSGPVLSPLRVLGLPVVAILMLIGIPTFLGHLQMWSAAANLHSVRSDFERIVVEERAVIVSLGDLGADVEGLERAVSAVTAATDSDARNRALLALAQELMLEGDRVSAPGSLAWEEAEARLERIERAHQALAQQHEAYEDASESLLGRLAFLAR